MKAFRVSLAALAFAVGFTVPNWTSHLAAQRGAGGGEPWPGMKHLLAVAAVQSGFHHDSISHALATVEQIGRKSGAYATMIRTDSQLITNDPIVGKDRHEGRGV